MSIDKIDWYFARHYGTNLNASFEPVDITEVIASGLLVPFQQVEWRDTGRPAPLVTRAPSPRWPEPEKADRTDLRRPLAMGCGAFGL